MFLLAALLATGDVSASWLAAETSNVPYASNRLIVTVKIFKILTRWWHEMKSWKIKAFILWGH